MLEVSWEECVKNLSCFMSVSMLHVHDKAACSCPCRIVVVLLYGREWQIVISDGSADDNLRIFLVCKFANFWLVGPANLKFYIAEVISWTFSNANHVEGM
jgi:hypothetical protein